MKIKGEFYEIDLKKMPNKGCVIIEGFPGLGFVSTIACDYMIKQLRAEKIGSIFTKKISPLTAIHEYKVIEPILIYYSEPHNIVIIQSQISAEGIEYDMAEIIIEFAKKIHASHIITIEGVTTYGAEPTDKVFFYTSEPKFEDRLLKADCKKMKEGIIVGVTGALLLKSNQFPLIGLFVEVHGEMADNKASATIIKTLDKYLGLSIDYEPLLRRAEETEKKLREFITKLMQVKKEKEKKIVGYAG